MHFIKSIINFILNIIFPPKCVFCGRIIEPYNRNTHFDGHYPYCADCESKISFCADYPCCLKCGKPSMRLDNFGICKNCRGVNADTYTVRAVSVFIYKDVVRSSILRYKLNGFKHYANYYSSVMYDRIVSCFSDVKFDIITSVPSTKKNRKSKIDFDHSQMIAEKLSKRMNIKYSRCLKKLASAAHQRGLTYSERVKNLHNNIRFIKFRNVRGKTILLVDDVLTTGSTARECSRVLLSVGAKSVYAVTLATVVKENLNTMQNEYHSELYNMLPSENEILNS